MNADKKNLRGTERQQGIRETREVAKILLVEDNEMNRDMLSRRRLRKGYEVLIAVDGAEGVEMAHEQSPALILMDMSLPVLDGWGATRRWQGAGETARDAVCARHADGNGAA